MGRPRRRKSQGMGCRAAPAPRCPGAALPSSVRRPAIEPRGGTAAAAMAYNAKEADAGMSTIGRARSNWWYALPVLLSIVGGLIAYFALRADDASKAKNCLYVGFAMVAIDVVVVIAAVAVGLALA